MTAYSPPLENLPVFDADLFHSVNTGPLTIAIADARYLKYPAAQGSENLQSINVDGLATFSQGASFSSLPLCSSVPTLANQLINKTYVDGSIITSLASYLTIASAASIYATITSLASYLTASTAASTYATITSLASYLTASTAASTYATITSLASYVDTSSTQTITGSKTFSNTLTAPSAVQTTIVGVPSGVNSTTSNLSMTVQGYNNVGQSITLTSSDPYTSAGLGNSYSNIVVNTDATYPVALTASQTVFGSTNTFTLGVQSGGMVLASSGGPPTITGTNGGSASQVWIYSGIYVSGGVSSLSGGIVNTIGGSFGGSAPSNTNQVGEFIPTGSATVYSSNSTYSGAYFQHRTIITGAATTTRNLTMPSASGLAGTWVCFINTGITGTNGTIQILNSSAVVLASIPASLGFGAVGSAVKLISNGNNWYCSV